MEKDEKPNTALMHGIHIAMLRRAGGLRYVFCLRSEREFHSTQTRKRERRTESLYVENNSSQKLQRQKLFDTNATISIC